MKNLCKRNGTCSSDDICRFGCGCMNGTVVYAGGQNCQSDGNFVDGVQCEILRTIINWIPSKQFKGTGCHHYPIIFICPRWCI